jgi:hypothetical protein
MPSQYQRDNLQALLGLFLEAQGHPFPFPQHSKTKSASALSRSLNIYSWSTRKLIRITRDYVLQQIRLVGLKFPVSVSWYYLKRDNGKLEKRFVLSTKQLKGSTITWWGRRRWQIEGWFKTAKHRFGLHRFGQGTLLGVYRWLVLSLIAYLLAHWAYLSSGTTDLPDWGQAAQSALQGILPQLLVFLFLLELERMRPLALSHGIYIQISRCKM